MNSATRCSAKQTHPFGDRRVDRHLTRCRPRPPRPNRKGRKVPFFESFPLPKLLASSRSFHVLHGTSSENACCLFWVGASSRIRTSRAPSSVRACVSSCFFRFRRAKGVRRGEKHLQPDPLVGRAKKPSLPNGGEVFLLKCTPRLDLQMLGIELMLLFRTFLVACDGKVMVFHGVPRSARRNLFGWHVSSFLNIGAISHRQPLEMRFATYTDSKVPRNVALVDIKVQEICLLGSGHVSPICLWSRS